MSSMPEWEEDIEWEEDMELEEDSEEDRDLEEEPQVEWPVQLEWFDEAYSAYVADIAQRLGCSVLKEASNSVQQPRAKVRVRNLVTKQWEGPYDLIAMGRGYACVSTDTGTRWLPSKCVRPDLRPQRQNSADRQGGSRDQLESHQVDESLSDHSDDSSTDSD
ncbi:hypothetical protein DUI87_02143 [Hirundo rustica rustica]|uniref:Integrase-type domain-containing protein n=1 Tax=Hirundo rustica rustica TaxID=333673 RepID=A0A3M0L6H6_HIRRU|nr:hypothetical protein DUI87_02143 [Hirundo rustica rustica]